MLVLAIAISIGAPLAAHADSCDWRDAGQAAKDVGSSDFWKKCDAELVDPVYWGLLLFLGGGALGQDAESSNTYGTTPQPNVTVKFCNDALAAINGGIGKKLSDLFGDLSDSQKQQLNDTLSPVLGDAGLTDLASIGDPFTCACEAITMKGLSELGGVIGDCVHDEACQLSHNQLACCPQSPAPLVHIDCSKRPCASDSDSNCSPNNYLQFTGSDGVYDTCGNYYSFDPFCVGSTCYSQDPNQPDNGSNTYVCSCPVAMQVVERQPSNGQNGYIQCLCPPGSTQKGDQCLCPDGTALAWNGANVPPSCPFKPPPPLCAPKCGGGQVANITDKATCAYTCQCPDGQVSSGGKCITPCAGGEAMLAGGACCAASQTTSCGACCPSGMKPDGTGATCVSRALGATPVLTPATPMQGKP